MPSAHTWQRITLRMINGVRAERLPSQCCVPTAQKRFPAGNRGEQLVPSSQLRVTKNTAQNLCQSIEFVDLLTGDLNRNYLHAGFYSGEDSPSYYIRGASSTDTDQWGLPCGLSHPVPSSRREVPYITVPSMAHYKS